MSHLVKIIGIILLLLVFNQSSYAMKLNLTSTPIINENDQSYYRSVKGIFDRLENNYYAVLLIESTGEEIIVPKYALPFGSTVQSGFHLVLNREGEVLYIYHDQNYKHEQMNKSKALLEQLREKKTRSLK
ncbi:hypothetical protein [Ornithinibacillus halophilus]|uniref:DUF3006 domain-containing protein n=1 Tax=Ornithinibacillus halophilus TaxID=930117 RepID=A0A1M5J5J3_9BACI|nr:hypothetical protein [Ornithinibacillus halophilus]SHG35854.1 hypothetical protein SAMN05216225_102819 [Ornithinibacillus halophilus]